MQEFKLSPYPYILWVSKNPNYDQFIDSYTRDPLSIEHPSTRVSARSILNVIHKDTNRHGHIIHLIRPDPGIIAHEAFHVVNAIFEDIGSNINIQTDECVAYLLEDIVNKITNIKWHRK